MLIKNSVIIATKNRPGLLKKNLNSLTEQTVLPSEVVVIDTSEFSVLRIIKQFKNKLNIRYVYKKGLNAPQARNLGVSTAKNRYVLFLDDDCIAHKKWLEKMMNCCIHNSKAVVITGRLVHIPKENIFAKMLDALRKQRRQISKEYSPAYLNIDNCLFDKKWLLKNKIKFDERLKREEDIDMALQIIKYGGAIKFCSSAIVYHHVRGNLASFLKQRFLNGGNVLRLKKKWNPIPLFFFGAKRLDYLNIFIKLSNKFILEKKILELVYFQLVIVLSVIFYELGFIYSQFSEINDKKR